MNKVKTAIGGFLTAAILSFTLGYFVTKMQALINGSDPIIHESVIHDYYGIEDQGGLNLSKANQTFAISVNNAQGTYNYDP